MSLRSNLETLDNGDLRLADETGAVFLISVLQEDLIRVRYLPNGAPNPHMRRTWAIVDANGECPYAGHDRHNLDALKRFARPKVTVSVSAPSPEAGPPHDSAGVALWPEREAMGVVNTGTLGLHVQTPACFEIYDSARRLLAADHPLLSYRYDRRTGRIAHTMLRSQDEHYYGFGEKAGPLDKHARRLKMRNTDAFGYDAETGDPLYKHVPFYICLKDMAPGESAAYGIFYDTPYDCEFDMGAEIDNYYGDYRVFRVEGGDLDYYVMYGPTIERVVEQYTALTGRIPLPPRWSLGYLGSAMRYTDAPDAQTMLAEFVEKCKRHDIPCSAFQLSSGYTLGADGKRYVFTWNRQRIPDPKRMTQTFHDAGMKVAANVKPALLTTHPRFAEAAPLTIRAANADEPDLAPFWGGQGAHLDFTNPATIDWWKANLKAQLFDFGIDHPWNDNNEFNIRDDAARCHGFGNETPSAALKPIHTTIIAMASYDAQHEYAPERRPWLVTRAGYAGTQRYAATWTGDNRASWKTLRYNIPMGLGLSLSGYANVGHDVGGFAGEPPEPELFLRWVQNGIFHPRFCIHSWRTDDFENAPWMYPDLLPDVRDLLRFRLALAPYLYSLLREAAQTGHPVIRPMVYHFQHDPDCHTQSFEFLLGPSLLVASVIEPGAQTRAVYLPRGAGWYNWHTGAYYAGGQVVTLDAPLRGGVHAVPLLAREGALIPIQAGEGQYQVYVFPHRESGSSSFELYEDDGETSGYRRGAYRIIDLGLETAPERIKVTSSVEVVWRLPEGEGRTVEQVIG